MSERRYDWEWDLSPELQDKLLKGRQEDFRLLEMKIKDGPTTEMLLDVCVQLKWVRSERGRLQTIKYKERAKKYDAAIKNKPYYPPPKPPPSPPRKFRKCKAPPPTPNPPSRSPSPSKSSRSRKRY